MPFLSLEFLLVSLAAALWLAALRGRAREIGFLGLSGYVAWTWLGAAGTASTLGLCLIGFIAARLARRSRAACTIGVSALTALFIYLRHYSFLDAVLPPGLTTDLLATAGLSYLFFKLLHVVVDSAAGTIERLPPLAYLCYCFNFTAFLLGPIQRYQDFAAQWTASETSPAPPLEAYVDAVNRLLRGLVKKYVVAELIGPYALSASSDVAGLPLWQIAAGAYVFYLFLYFDFSGYCDIVIGVGALIGVRPPENFFLPFFAPNIAQYWLRVHRSLTTWLTDYVFNPVLATCLRSERLGRRPAVSTSLALLVTMMVSGLWHGTTVNFLLFGLLHGGYLVVFRLFETALGRRLGRKGLRRLRSRWWWKAAAVALTYNLTSLAYLLFVLDVKSLGVLLERITP